MRSVELIQIANKKGAPLPPAMDKQHQMLADKLSQLQGPEFDRMYMRHMVDDHKEAVALFEEAIASRAQWKQFPGFTARITGNVDGRPFEGKVTVNAGGGVELETKEKAARKWAKDQLESIVLHRAAVAGGAGLGAGKVDSSGVSSRASRNSAPSARSPATGRALIIAARSQFCPMLS